MILPCDRFLIASCVCVDVYLRRACARFVWHANSEKRGPLCFSSLWGWPSASQPTNPSTLLPHLFLLLLFVVQKKTTHSQVVPHNPFSSIPQQCMLHLHLIPLSHTSAYGCFYFVFIECFVFAATLLCLFVFPI